MLRRPARFLTTLAANVMFNSELNKSGQIMDDVRKKITIPLACLLCKNKMTFYIMVLALGTYLSAARDQKLKSLVFSKSGILP